MTLVRNISHARTCLNIGSATLSQPELWAFSGSLPVAAPRSTSRPRECPKSKTYYSTLYTPTQLEFEYPGVECERFLDVADFERDKEVYRKALCLDDDMLDDAYVSALLGAGRATCDVAAGCAKRERYLTLFPSGRHVEDMSDWQKRLRGELKSHFVKERYQ